MGGFYTQIFALGLIFSIWDAIGCGANDVANAFATAVNSKTLTMMQAMMIATVMELLGALTLGSYNASTIRSGIINTVPFINNGGAFMLAMFCTVFASSWFNFCSNRFGWATSSTHAVIGALIGVGVASGAGVNWGYTVTATSQSGLGAVFASFVISPVLAGVIGSVLFLLVKYIVLRRGGKRSFLWALRSAPFWYALVAAFEAWLIVWKSPRLPSVTDTQTIAVFFGVFAVVGFLTWAFIQSYLWRTIWLGWSGVKWYHMPLMCLPDSLVLKLVPGADRHTAWFDDRHLTGEPVPENETYVWDQADAVALARKRGLMPAKSVRRLITSADSKLTLVPVSDAEAAAVHAAVAIAGSSASSTASSEPSTPMASSKDLAALGDCAPGTSTKALLAVSPAEPAAPAKTLALEDVPHKHKRPTFASAGAPPEYTKDAIIVGADGKPLSAWKMRKAQYAADWEATRNPLKRGALFAKFWIFAGVDRDIADYGLEDTDIAELHDAKVAERFYGKTESVFRALQVLTSCLSSFSHGANDVSLSVGPISALYYYWNQGGRVSPPKSTEVLDWQLAVGGVSLVLGLWFYGYNMMRVLGNRMTFHSPSRGFCMELGAAITVLIAARNGIPVSTTNCIVGATFGVGLCNMNFKAVNWKLAATTVLMWIFTVPACGLCSGLLYALIAYSPRSSCTPASLVSRNANVTLGGSPYAFGVNTTSYTIWPSGC